jgi:hypothetical protein
MAMRARRLTGKTFAGVFLCALAIVSTPVDVEAQPSQRFFELEDPLDFGSVPAGANLEVDPEEPRAARVRVSFASVPGGFLPCEDEPAEFSFYVAEPLVGPDGATLEVSFSPSSGRIWRDGDPGGYVEFFPGVQAAQFPIDLDGQFLVALGGAVTPSELPMGEYVGSGVLEMTYTRRAGNCSQVATVDVDIPILLEVQRGLSVEAALDTIDLGTLFHGMIVHAPADGGGDASPAPFFVSGPESLPYRLIVATRNLEHETEADELPLVFTGGLFGLDPEPEHEFSSGVVVPASEHGGGPLHVHCGFRVEVPPGVAEGAYQGEVTLIVEVLLH